MNQHCCARQEGCRLAITRAFKARLCLGTSVFQAQIAQLDVRHTPSFASNDGYQLQEHVMKEPWLLEMLPTHVNQLWSYNRCLVGVWDVAGRVPPQFASTTVVVELTSPIQSAQVVFNYSCAHPSLRLGRLSSRFVLQ
jgi:hypothetical protein